MELFSKLKRLPDVNPLISRFSSIDSGKRGAKLEDCVKLYHYSQTIFDIIQIIQPNPYFSSLFMQHEENSTKIIELVNKSIDMTSKSLEKDYKIKPEFDPTLIEINKNIQQNDAEIEELRKQSSIDLGLTKELQITQSLAQGLLFEGSKKEIHNGLRETPQYGFTIVSHLQTNVKITCVKLKKLSRIKEKLLEEYLNAQVDLEHKIIEYVSEFLPYIIDSNDLVGHLDAILSLAHACFTAPSSYCRPVFNDYGIIDIKSSRHPYLEQNCLCVENDIYMQKYQKNLVLITGPNMGGKSTFLKQIALCVIMAHIGCFLPADSANLCIVDIVFARITTCDNQLSGVSTFMSEMKDVSRLLNKATCDSFLIIDELGRGTSTSDGLGIAWALVDYLAKLGCFCLFATHFSELATIGGDNICNFYTDISISQDSILMKYKIIPGSISSSYGIEIAKMANMTDVVIDAAYEIRKEKEELKGCLQDIQVSSIMNLYNKL